MAIDIKVGLPVSSCLQAFTTDRDLVLDEKFEGEKVIFLGIKFLTGNTDGPLIIFLHLLYLVN